MQPENNTQNNAGAEIDAALKSAEAPTQENVMAQGTASGDSTGEKSKMSKKQIIGLVVLSLIAIGGVLFGIYGMNSQNEQIAQLTVRATDAEGKVAQLETNQITIVDSDGGTTEITDSVTVNDINTEDYIYVGEWGLKIKILDEMVIVRYKFANGTDDSSSLCVMGYNKKDIQGTPSFIDNDEYLACVSRVVKDSSSYGALIMSDDKYDYLFNGAQTYYSNDGDVDWEKESRELMSRAFGNADNYSAINNTVVGNDGFYVQEIGACFGDGGTGEASHLIIKCNVVTDKGQGKFVYTIEDGLRLVMAPEE